MADLDALGEMYPIQVPPFFALILRAFSVIEVGPGWWWEGTPWTFCRRGAASMDVGRRLPMRASAQYSYIRPETPAPCSARR